MCQVKQVSFNQFYPTTWPEHLENASGTSECLRALLIDSHRVYANGVMESIGPLLVLDF